MTTDNLTNLVPEAGWITQDKPRLMPLSDEELSFPKRALLFLMLKIGKARCPNIFRTLLRNFRVYFPFVRFNATIMPKGELSRRQTELAILRVAWKTRSYYEWGQHVEIGLRVGLSPSDIKRVTQGPDAPGWEVGETLIIRAVDELLDDRTVSATTWQALSEHLDENLMIELLFVITTYNSLACVLNSTGVRLEADIEDVLSQTALPSQLAS